MARLDLDLWFSSMSVRIERLNKRHRKRVCAVCGNAIRLQRVLVRRGVGRSQKSHVLCEDCGVSFARAMSADAEAMARRLMNDDTEGAIRQGGMRVYLP